MAHVSALESEGESGVAAVLFLAGEKEKENQRKLSHAPQRHVQHTFSWCKQAQPTAFTCLSTYLHIYRCICSFIYSFIRLISRTNRWISTSVSQRKSHTVARSTNLTLFPFHASPQDRRTLNMRTRIPENTQNTRKYPKIPRIPESRSNTHSFSPADADDLPSGPPLLLLLLRCLTWNAEREKRRWLVRLRLERGRRAA